jgi:hypothetical protein
MSQKRKDSKSLDEEKIAAGKGKRGRKRKGMCLEDRPLLEANAAGIDIGAREIFVAVPPDRDADPVQVFSTFTEDLERMAQWLVSCGVTTAAMESGMRQDPLKGDPASLGRALTSRRAAARIASSRWAGGSSSEDSR